MSEQAKQPQLQLARVYLKDASFEAPQSPEIFKKPWQPQVHLDLNTQSRHLEGDLHDTTLTLTVTVKSGEETAFVVEIKQGGIFQLVNIEGALRQQALGSACPAILFPYAREAIDNLVVKGGFPALMLPQPNFDQMLQQTLARAAQPEAAH